MLGFLAEPLAVRPRRLLFPRPLLPLIRVFEPISPMTRQSIVAIIDTRKTFNTSVCPPTSDLKLTSPSFAYSLYVLSRSPSRVFNRQCFCIPKAVRHTYTHGFPSCCPMHRTPSPYTSSPSTSSSLASGYITSPSLCATVSSAVPVAEIRLRFCLSTCG